MAGRKKGSPVRTAGIVLAIMLLAIAGCRQAAPPAEPTGPTGRSTAAPAPRPEVRWSVETLTTDYPLSKIEVAGTYEQIGYALGRWYQDRGFSPRALTGGERQQARELIEFYSSPSYLPRDPASPIVERSWFSLQESARWAMMNSPGGR